MPQNTTCEWTLRLINIASTWAVYPTRASDMLGGELQRKRANSDFSGPGSAWVRQEINRLGA